MMKITGLSHLFKWENLHNWWLTKYCFAPLYIYSVHTVLLSMYLQYIFTDCTEDNVHNTHTYTQYTHT